MSPSRIGVALAITLGVVTTAALVGPRGAEDRTPEAFIALPFTICDGFETVDVQPPDSPFRRVACARICPTGQLCDDEDTAGPMGHPRHRVAFTVDGVAGALRWNDPPRHGATAFLLVHGGGDGTQFADNEGWEPLMRDGLVVVGLRWHPGIVDPITHDVAGWMSKTDVAPAPWADRTARVAAPIRWAHDRLSGDKPFGLMGTSNGGLAVVGAIAWHGLDEIVDYTMISSGNLPWDLSARCAHGAGTWSGTGLCEAHPELDCTTDAACGDGRCAWPQIEPGLAGRLDYWFATGDDCRNGRPNKAFDQSSLMNAPDLLWTHPVDFVIAERDGERGADEDTRMGITWQDGMFYRALQTTDERGKRWFDMDGFGHGQGSGNPALAERLHCAIRRGLAVPGGRCEGGR